MCGIAGFSFGESAPELRIEDLRANLSRMAELMAHRGPDEPGEYVDEHVALTMRRLSIIDLETGRQPIGNETEDIWTVCNGEIYNFPTLRRDLERRGHSFRSKSDVEVIVHLYEEYGDRCVEHLKGMFAFALWDCRSRKLLLARDRLGIKPLYYAVSHGMLIFASEMKSILGSGLAAPEMDLAALDAFLAFRYVPGPMTLCGGVRKLMPGHVLVWDTKSAVPHIRSYWQLPPDTLQRPPEQQEWRAELLSLLRQSVQSMLMSDVPLGAMLSGGIDSSLIVALMSEVGSKVRTFSVGFEDADECNELEDARRVAKYFGTDHSELYVSAKDHEQFLPDFVWHLDEPVANFSAVTFNFVSRLAAGSVKVALSGQGSDELFGGYQRYVGEKLAPYYQSLPRFLREGLIPAAVERVPRAALAKRAVRALNQEDAETRFLAMSTLFDESMKNELCAFGSSYISDGRVALESARDGYEALPPEDSLRKALYLDTKFWLPDDMLLTFDKMSMANSLEVRVPYLDEDLVEFAWRMPSSLKIRRMTTKYMLKDVAAGCLPEWVIKKKKMGFPAPIDRWFRTCMKEYVLDVLTDDRTRQRGWFRQERVDALLKAHLSGGRDLGKQLFALICLELWQRAFMDAFPESSLAAPRPREDTLCLDIQEAAS